MPTPVRTGPEFLVNAATDGWQYAPAITRLSDGRMVIAWADQSEAAGDTSGQAVRARILAASGTAIGTEFVVNTTTDGSQFAPSVTALAGGGFVVVWADLSGFSGSVVRAQVFAADATPLGPELPVNTTVQGSHGEPRVTALQGGGFVVVWTDGAGDAAFFSDIRAQVFDAEGGRVGAELLVNTTTRDWQERPVVTALQDGGFMVAWTDGTQSPEVSYAGAIRAQVFAADGSHQSPEFQVRATVPDRVFIPLAATLGDGRVVMVWSEDSAAGGIQAQFLTADGALSGSAFRVDPTTPALRFANAVTALSEGRFVVVWSEAAPSDGLLDFDIRAQVFMADGTPSGDIFEVNATTAEAQFEATVSALGNGRFVVTWTDGSLSPDDPSGTAVRAQIFDADTHLTTGTSGADTLPGTADDDLIRGFAGADRLGGSAGIDTMEGGLGNDTYFVDALGDVVRGEVAFASGGGIDTVFTSVNFTAPVNVELVRAVAGAAGLTLIGNDAPGTLVGNDGANRLEGRGGNDQVNGNGGNDTIVGGEGRDTLVGGAGADTFVFSAVSNSRAGVATRDYINGFTRAPGDQDVIDLSAIDANTLTAGVNNAFTFIGAVAFSGTGTGAAAAGAVAGQLRLVGLGGPNAVIVEADVNGDRVADFQIFVNTQTTMVVGDFIL